MFAVIDSSLHGFITDQNNDQLPVGLLVQLVKRCTGIAEVMGSNSLQTWIFFQVLFSLLQWSLSFINWFVVHIFFFIYHIQNTKCFDLKIRRASVTVILQFATRGIVWELFITEIWNIWHLKFKEIFCYHFLWSTKERTLISKTNFI